jgi:hypothetical protein
MSLEPHELARHFSGLLDGLEEAVSDCHRGAWQLQLLALGIARPSPNPLVKRLRADPPPDRFWIHLRPAGCAHPAMALRLSEQL